VHLKSYSILIIHKLTSFGGSKNIYHKIRSRGHTVYDYVSIHPATPLAEGIPTLHLSASQKLVRDGWVNVKEPYQCRTTWLEETWNGFWVHPRKFKGRSVDSQSLQSLAVYAVDMCFDPDVYKKLLFMCSMGVQVQDVAFATNSMRVDSGDDYRTRWSHREEPYYPPRTFVHEKRPLLSYAPEPRNASRHITDYPKTTELGWWSLCLCIASCMFSCAFIFGIGYAMWIALRCAILVWKDPGAAWGKFLTWLIIAWKETVSPIAIALWNKSTALVNMDEEVKVRWEEIAAWVAAAWKETAWPTIVALWEGLLDLVIAALDWIIDAGRA